MAVDGPGKNHAGNRGNGGRLGGATIRSRIAGLRRGVPRLLPIGDAESGEAAALGGIGLRADLDRIAAPGFSREIGDGGVDFLPVAGHAPLHAAVGASFAHASLPQDFAFAFRIERVDYAGFLAGQQNVPAVSQFLQQHGGAEIVIRAGALGGGASPAENIARRDLPGPKNTAVFEIQREDRVTHVGGGRRKIVAGRDVQDAAFGVEGRRSPDAGAGRPPGADQSLRVIQLFRYLANGVSLPDLGSILGAQSRYTSAERAAAVLRIARAGFFPRSSRNENQAVIYGRGARQASRFVFLGSLLPKEASGFGFERVCPTGEIGKNQRVRLADGHGHGRGTYGAAGLVNPTDTAGISAQRLHGAARATHEQGAA